MSMATKRVAMTASDHRTTRPTKWLPPSRAACAPVSPGRGRGIGCTMDCLVSAMTLGASPVVRS
jgi:hypothetical protein